MATNLPFSFQGEQSSIDRKRRMAEALIGQFSSPGQAQMVSGNYVAPNPVQAILGPALGMLASENVQKGFDQQQQDLGNRYRSELAQGLEGYLTTRQGKAGETLSDQQASDLLDNDQAPPELREPVAADPRRAAVEALTSQFPELQALGKQDFASMGKDQLSQKDILGLSDFDPKAKLLAALTGDVSKLAPKRRYMNVDGRVVDESDPTQIGADYREDFGEPFNVGGDLYQRDSRGKVYKLDNAPKVNVNTSIDNVGNKVSLEQAGKVLGGARQDMLDSMNARKAAERIMALSKDPATIQGFAAGPMAGLASVGAKLGFTGPDAAAKTQALVAELSGRALETGQDMKGSFSDKDIQFLRDVSTGNIALTPEVIQHTAGLAAAAAHNKTLNALNQYQSATSVNGVGEIVKLYPRPNINYQMDPKLYTAGDDGQVQFKSPLLTPAGSGASAPAPGQVMEWADYIKLKGR